MGLTDAEMISLKALAAEAAVAAEQVRNARRPEDVTLGQSMIIGRFMQRAGPKQVLALISEIDALKGRIVEMEADALDAAFERSNRDG